MWFQVPGDLWAELKTHVSGEDTLLPWPLTKALASELELVAGRCTVAAH